MEMKSSFHILSILSKLNNEYSKKQSALANYAKNITSDFVKEEKMDFFKILLSNDFAVGFFRRSEPY